MPVIQVTMSQGRTVGQKRELVSNLPVVRYEDILKKPFRLKEICNGVKKQLHITS